MKKLIRTICVALITLCATFSATAAVGDVFDSGQFRFQVLNEDNEVALIAYIVNITELDEDLVIPGEVTYEETTYRVTAIDDNNPETGGYGPFCKTNIVSVKIPDTVTLIGDGAFMMCKSLTSVEIPNSVNTIDQFAFDGCTSLTNIEIPNSVTTIGYMAFSESGLTNIEIPNSVTTIDKHAFAKCTNLASVSFGNSVTTIGGFAFSGCSNLVTAPLPASLIVLGDRAFMGCALTEVSIPQSVTTIEDIYNMGPFYDCPIETLSIDCKEIPNWVFGRFETLQTLKIGDIVTTIGASAFNGCTNLKTVEIGSAVKTVGEYAFRDCGIETLTINSAEIGQSWFSNLPSLTTLTLGNNVKSIGYGAFYNCSISELTIPEAITSIDQIAFANNKITSLTLLKTLTSVGSGAFYGCPIEKLYVNTGADINGVFSYNNLTDVIFGEEASTIPSFDGAGLLTNVKLPAQLEALPTNAFRNCSSLEELELPATVKEIGSNAFYGCNLLIGLQLPEELTTIGSYAFANCTSLNGLNIPQSVNSIGSYAFSNCTTANIFRLPENVTTISNGLFAGCAKLEKVYFSDKVSSIGSYAFANCPELRSMIIPDGVKAVPSYMMQGCSSLYEILVPNSVTSIGEGAFSGCSSLINIDLGTGVYEIADKVFENCDNIKDIHSMALNPPYAEMYSFPIEAYNKAMVTVQEQSLTKYNQQNPWYRFSNYLTVSGAISLSHYQVDMAGNEVFQLGVYGAKSDIVWTSSNPSVAYANKCGLIVALGITGSTTITAHVDGEEINCRVTVSAVQRPTKVKALAQEEETVSEPVDIIIESIGGYPPMVNARLIPVGSCTVIDWTTSDDNLATVENGIVTVKGKGEVEFGADTENGLSENLGTDTADIEMSGIEDIVVDDANVDSSNNVYDLTGRCVLNNASQEQISRLNKGIYIINGKKVLVK